MLNAFPEKKLVTVFHKSANALDANPIPILTFLELPQFFLKLLHKLEAFVDILREKFTYFELPQLFLNFDHRSDAFE